MIVAGRMRRLPLAVLTVAAILAAPLVVAAAPAPDVTAGSKGTVELSGLVTVQGDGRCTGQAADATITLELLIDEGAYPKVAESATQISFPCSRKETRWVATFGTFTDVPFVPGTAHLHVNTSACDTSGCVFLNRVDQVVILKLHRPR